MINVRRGLIGLAAVMTSAALLLWLFAIGYEYSMAGFDCGGSYGSCGSAGAAVRFAVYAAFGLGGWSLLLWLLSRAWK